MLITHAFLSPQPSHRSIPVKTSLSSSFFVPFKRSLFIQSRQNSAIESPPGSNTLYYYILFYTNLQYKILFCIIISSEVMDMKPLKQRVSLTLDEEVIEKIKILAEDCDRSFSQYVNIVLKEHIKENVNNK